MEKINLQSFIVKYTVYNKKRIVCYQKQKLKKTSIKTSKQLNDIFSEIGCYIKTKSIVCWYTSALGVEWVPTWIDKTTGYCPAEFLSRLFPNIGLNRKYLGKIAIAFS